jgi:hypothetical protein
VSSVHLNEAEQRLLDGPVHGCAFFDPVAGDCEIGIGIVSLPCIASQADFAANGGALISEE